MTGTAASVRSGCAVQQVPALNTDQHPRCCHRIRHVLVAQNLRGAPLVVNSGFHGRQPVGQNQSPYATCEYLRILVGWPGGIAPLGHPTRSADQRARAPVTVNRSTAATCPPVAAAIVITAPGVTWNVTLADHGLLVPPAARQQ
jgi:hypothetical protein